MPTTQPCPSCGASVDFPDDGAQITCPYCGSVVHAGDPSQSAKTIISSGNAKTIISSGSVDELKTLLSAGNKIEAIKVYREMTGVGLKEAKDVVESIEKGEEPVIPTPEPEVVRFQNSAEMMDEVKRLLYQENKIEAIKVYREFFNTGLKEAKDAVDQAEADLKFFSTPTMDTPESPATVFVTPEPAPRLDAFPESPKSSSPWKKIAMGCGAALFLMCCCGVLGMLLFFWQIAPN